MFLSGFAALGWSQSASSGLKTKVDAVIDAAYNSASADFPSTEGNAKPGCCVAGCRECLNAAFDRVSWDDAWRLQIRERIMRYTEMLLAMKTPRHAHRLTGLSRE
jgi:hypothetical protein